MKSSERHEIKSDKFLETMAVVEEFFIKNARTIGLVILAVIVLAFGSIAVNKIIEGSQDKAAYSLNALYGDLMSSIFVAEEANEDSMAALTTKVDEHLKAHGSSKSGMIAEYQFAISLLQAGKTEEAVSKFNKVYESNMNLVWGLAADQLAKLEIRNNNYDAALNYYKRAADKNAAGMPNSYFQVNTAMCYKELGDTANALSYYEKAAASDYVSLNQALTLRIRNEIAQLKGE